jgi:threonine dehydrogenase-like Zn-dependent dehydrogenase
VRAAVWNDRGSLDVVDRPVPEPKPGWVRVAVSAVGICGTDLHFFSGAFPSPTGLLPGHEIGGTVDTVGDTTDDGPAIEPGQAVAVEPLVTCGRCPHCRAGAYTRCPTRMLLGVTGRGGMAELMTAPAASLYPLPAGLTGADGALVEPLAVCVRGVRRAGVGLGDRVLVLGAGTIGLLCVFAALAAGASEVAVTARHPHQQAAAAAFGATVFASADEAAAALGDSWADVVLETVGGHAPTLGEAVRLARPGGRIGMLGIFDRDAALPGLDFSTKELQLVGSNCYARAGVRSDFDLAVALLAPHADHVRRIVTHRFSLDEVNEAFRTAADKSERSIKVAIQPSSNAEEVVR